MHCIHRCLNRCKNMVEINMIRELPCILLFIYIHTYILRAYYYITAKFPHADMARANAEHRIINYIYCIINFLSRKYF